MLSVLNMFISFSPSIPLLPKKSKGSDCSLLKTNKQARLVERKVGFISDVDYWGREVGGRLTKSRLPSSTAANQWGKSFYRQKNGDRCRNSTVNSDSNLQIDYQWSDQRHLDCFRYS